MTRLIWTSTLALCVGTMLQADHTKPAPAPVATTAPAGPTAIYHAPFGYFQTHWRAFPTVSETLPEPGPKAPVASTPLHRDNSPASDKAPVVVGRNSKSVESNGPATRKPEPTPAPPPASTVSTTKPPARPERGFATLRSPNDMPIATSQATPIPAPPIPPPPIVRTPVIDSGVRPVRGDDDVLRPAWPTLPPPKK